MLECAAIGHPDDRLGERLIAIVTLVPNAEATEDEILRSCGERLTKNKIPKQIIISKTPMPRNATGKLIKPEIRKQYEQG